MHTHKRCVLFGGNRDVTLFYVSLVDFEGCITWKLSSQRVGNYPFLPPCRGLCLEGAEAILDFVNPS